MPRLSRFATTLNTLTHVSSHGRRCSDTRGDGEVCPDQLCENVSSLFVPR